MVTGILSAVSEIPLMVTDFAADWVMTWLTWSKAPTVG